jgi:hypothetical protein
MYLDHTHSRLVVPFVVRATDQSKANFHFRRWSPPTYSIIGSEPGGQIFCDNLGDAGEKTRFKKMDVAIVVDQTRSHSIPSDIAFPHYFLVSISSLAILL